MEKTSPYGKKQPENQCQGSSHQPPYEEHFDKHQRALWLQHHEPSLPLDQLEEQKLRERWKRGESELVMNK